MIMEQVKQLVKNAGYLRMITKKGNDIYISDLTLNCSGELILDEYSGFTMKDLKETAGDLEINGDTISEFLNYLNLWCFDEDDDKFFTKIEAFFSDYDIERLDTTIPKLDLNDAVVGFINSTSNKMLIKEELFKFAS